MEDKLSDARMDFLTANFTEEELLDALKTINEVINEDDESENEDEDED